MFRFKKRPASPKPGDPPIDFTSLTMAMQGVEMRGGSMTDVISMLRRRRQIGRTVFFIGNGGSAAIASHMAADWLKAGKFKAMCFNDGAQVTCLANDTGYDNVFAEPLKRHAEAGDVLFAISSSGRSKSILNAAGAARNLGVDVIALSGFDRDNPLRECGDIEFYVPSNRYGSVEITHLAICHAILDRLATQ